MKHRVIVHVDEDEETAWAECRDCSWGASGPTRKVDDKADEHERDEERSL